MSQSERDPYSYPTRQRMDLYSLVSNPSSSSTIKRSKEGIRMKEMLVILIITVPMQVCCYFIDLILIVYCRIEMDVIL